MDPNDYVSICIINKPRDCTEKCVKHEKQLNEICYTLIIFKKKCLIM
jgi:hypothetical protein